jgi:hypothetical protein
MSQKVVNRIIDQTSASGGSLTIDIPTEYLDGLIIVGITVGAAAATAMTLNLFDETPSPGPGTGIAAPGISYATLTPPSAGASSVYEVGPSMPINVYMPRRTRLLGTAGAASTLRYVVYTVKFQ